MNTRKDVFSRALSGSFLCLGAAMLLGLAEPATAQDSQNLTEANEHAAAARPLTYIVPLGEQTSTLYHDGSQITIQLEERWRPMSHGPTPDLTLDDIRRAAEKHHAAFENGPTVVVDSGLRGSGLNLVFNLDGSVPTEAISSFAIAEEYLEGLFSDDVTVTINCNFDSLSGSALGFTNSTTVTGVSYRNSRLSLQYGMDPDDVIQDWLPTTNGCPVRYNGSSATVSNANSVVWNLAPYKATVGTAPGIDASMTYDSGTNWDYDASDGVGFFRISLVDVICHETGHALGFTSAVDIGSYMEVLDLYRFCRQDGTQDYNPDTYQEFQTTPRIVCFDNPDDEQNTDCIDFSHRMEDGNPNQASHLRMVNDNGCMCPQIGSGVTRYPDYFTEVDIHCFDAIGWEYPPCDSPQFTLQPTAYQMFCAGETAVLTAAVDVPGATYMWRRGADELVDDGVHIFGAATDTLTIVDLGADDSSNAYNCYAYHPTDGCPAISDWAEIFVDTDIPVFTQHPTDVAIDAGETALFQVGVENAQWVEYQWRRNGAPLTDNSRIFGSTSNMLVVTNAIPADAGDYDCLVTRITGSSCSKASETAVLTINGGYDCPNPGAAGYYCAADIDGSGDCIVDLGDLAQLLAHYGMTSGATHGDGDIDPEGGDGDVDLGDLAALLAQYGDDCN